jgi:hypothetical protein
MNNYGAKDQSSCPNSVNDLFASTSTSSWYSYNLLFKWNRGPFSRVLKRSQPKSHLTVGVWKLRTRNHCAGEDQQQFSSQLKHSAPSSVEITWRLYQLSCGRAHACGICGGQIGSEADYFPSTSVCPMNYYCTNATETWDRSQPRFISSDIQLRRTQQGLYLRHKRGNLYVWPSYFQEFVVFKYKMSVTNVCEF